MNLNAFHCILIFVIALLSFATACGDSVQPNVGQSDWAAVLGDSLKELEKNPTNPKARRSAWDAARHLGLFDQAAQLRPELANSERREQDGDHLALLIRYGKIDARTLQGPGRYRRLDDALKESTPVAEAFLVGIPADDMTRRTLIDRTLALIYREKHKEAIQLYEALTVRGITVPTWALNELAEAFLILHKPQRAQELYRQVLAGDPENFTARMGLFYSLSDDVRLNEAVLHIDQVLANLPQRNNKNGRFNNEYWSAAIASNQGRIWAGRFDEAEKRVAQRLAEAPYSSEARQSNLNLMTTRGWQRAGEVELRRIIGQDPENASLHAEHAELLLSLQRWLPAQEALDTARRFGPDSPAVKREVEAFDLHNRHELYIDAGYDWGDASGPYGNRDWRTESWLYSNSPWSSYRLFIHDFHSSGNFDGSWTDWNRTGIGTEWREGDWRATAELNAGSGQNIGLLATLRWQPTDQWKLALAADSLTNGIPLKAVRAGIDAHRLGAEIEWSQHAGRAVAVSATNTGFSDGNLRSALSVSWSEQLLVTPHWKIESILGADTSHNSHGDQTVYFNPTSDQSLWLSTAVEQLLWHEYQKSFSHRLTITGGEYWQSGFDGGAIAAVEYQHRWEVGKNLSLRYGAGMVVRPYDGAREERNFVTASILWRF
jgi:biofilm PGA synthesis protein PgaA